MSAGVVRQLVTRIAFTFDRTNLDRFERSIVGFRSRFILAAGAIGLAFKGVQKSIEYFTDNLLRIDAISTFAKTSSAALQGLITTFAKLGLEPNKFLNIFESLTLQILAASKGAVNELSNIMLVAGEQIQLRDANGLRKTEDILLDLIKFVSKHEGSDAIRLFTNILELSLTDAKVLLDIYKENEYQLKELIKLNTPNEEAINKQTKAAKEYQKAVYEIIAAWQELKILIGSIALPSIGGFFSSLSKDLQRINKFGFFHRENSESTNYPQFTKQPSNLFDKIFEDRQKLIELRQNEKLEDRPEWFFEKFSRLYDTGIVHGQVRASVAALSGGQFNFEFNVAPGTTLEQSQEMAGAVRAAMSGFMDEKVREIINNNPQVE